MFLMYINIYFGGGKVTTKCPPATEDVVIVLLTRDKRGLTEYILLSLSPEQLPPPPPNISTLQTFFLNSVEFISRDVYPETHT